MMATFPRPRLVPIVIAFALLGGSVAARADQRLALGLDLWGEVTDRTVGIVDSDSGLGLAWEAILPLTALSSGELGIGVELLLPRGAATGRSPDDRSYAILYGAWRWYPAASRRGFVSATLGWAFHDDEAQQLELVDGEATLAWGFGGGFRFAGSWGIEARFARIEGDPVDGRFDVSLAEYDRLNLQLWHRF